MVRVVVHVLQECQARDSKSAADRLLSLKEVAERLGCTGADGLTRMESRALPVHAQGRRAAGGAYNVGQKRALTRPAIVSS